MEWKSIADQERPIIGQGVITIDAFGALALNVCVGGGRWPKFSCDDVDVLFWTPAPDHWPTELEWIAARRASGKKVHRYGLVEHEVPA